MCGSMSKDKVAPPKYKGGMKRDLLIKDLWTQETDSIQNMCVVNTDAVSHQPQNPKKCMETAERYKNKQYLHAYLSKHWNFTPFVATVDGLLVFKAAAKPKHIARCFTTKRKEPYSHTCRFVNIRVAITLVRATQHCIQGARVPASKISVTQTQW